jgi:hypothetical protein
MIMKLLIWLGFRSGCCRAKKYFDDYDHSYCASCNRRI